MEVKKIQGKVHIYGNNQGGGGGVSTIAELALLLTTGVSDLIFYSDESGNGTNPDAPVADSTSHITLKSYQKALRATGHYGESLRLDFCTDFAKSTIAFRDGRPAGSPGMLLNQPANATKAWIVAHYEANGYDTRPIHKHMSIEVSNSLGSLETRMEFPYDQDICNIRFTESTVTNLLNSINVASNSTSNAGFVLQRRSTDVLSNQTDERYNGDTAIYSRWKMQFVDNPAVGDPANSGDNFTLSRWSDSGSFVSNVMKILRSNGNIGVGITTIADIIAKFNVLDSLRVTGINNSKITVNRGAATQFASLILSTGDVDDWTLRTRNNGTDDLELRRNDTTPWSAWRIYDATKHIYFQAPSVPIIDANLDNNTLCFYLDEGTNSIKTKVKYSNGTVKIATLALV